MTIIKIIIIVIIFLIAAFVAFGLLYMMIWDIKYQRQQSDCCNKTKEKLFGEIEDIWDNISSSLNVKLHAKFYLCLNCGEIIVRSKMRGVFTNNDDDDWDKMDKRSREYMFMKEDERIKDILKNIERYKKLNRI